MVEIIINSIKSLLGFNVASDVKEVNPPAGGVKIEVEDSTLVEDRPRLEDELGVKSVEKVLSVEDIYTPLSVAKEEIWRRWNDKELRKKVEDFLGGDVPEFLRDSPKAYLARYIASPNYESSRFLDLSKEINLCPVIPEFKNDKFTIINPVKYYLANLRVENSTGDCNLINIANDSCNGAKFCDMKTISGNNFIDFHHEMFREFEHEIDGCIFDISEWFNKNGKSSKKFYLHYLALFVCCGVLFENYLTDGEEGGLFEKTVLPNFSKIQEMFGCKPLIVRLLPEETEKDLHWYSYDKDKIKITLKNYGL